MTNIRQYSKDLAEAVSNNTSIPLKARVLGWGVIAATALGLYTCGNYAFNLHHTFQKRAESYMPLQRVLEPPFPLNDVKITHFAEQNDVRTTPDGGMSPPQTFKGDEVTTQVPNSLVYSMCEGRVSNVVKADDKYTVTVHCDAAANPIYTYKEDGSLGEIVAGSQTLNVVYVGLPKAYVMTGVPVRPLSKNGLPLGFLKQGEFMQLEVYGFVDYTWTNITSQSGIREEWNRPVVVESSVNKEADQEVRFGKRFVTTIADYLLHILTTHSSMKEEWSRGASDALLPKADDAQGQKKSLETCIVGGTLDTLVQDSSQQFLRAQMHVNGSICTISSSIVDIVVPKNVLLSHYDAEQKALDGQLKTLNCTVQSASCSPVKTVEYAQLVDYLKFLKPLSNGYTKLLDVGFKVRGTPQRLPDGKNYYVVLSVGPFSQVGTVPDGMTPSPSASGSKTKNGKNTPVPSIKPAQKDDDPL